MHVDFMRDLTVSVDDSRMIMRPKDNNGGAVLSLSILADSLGGGAGEARFVSGFLKTLFSSEASRGLINHLFLILTQGESTISLGPLPDIVSVVRRRFPFRLRGTGIASLWGRLMPRAKVAHGLSFYTFPFQGKHSIVTFHDASFLNDDFHIPQQKQIMLRAVTESLSHADAIVCISDSVVAQVSQAWPDLSEKCCRIYQGVEPIRMLPKEIELKADMEPYILTVGTVEPRKNYHRLLEAYEHLLATGGPRTPRLFVVGREGWMSEELVKRLRLLEATGKVRWLKGIPDDALADYYRRAAIFTYLSLYEGFGYPPFEAAYAHVPMVLSNSSAVGELWSKHACCVDPTDVREIVNGWKWALDLTGDAREEIVNQQLAWAKEFSWERCVNGYLHLYQRASEGLSG